MTSAQAAAPLGFSHTLQKEGLLSCFMVAPNKTTVFQLSYYLCLPRHVAISSSFHSIPYRSCKRLESIDFHSLHSFTLSCWSSLTVLGNFQMEDIHRVLNEVLRTCPYVLGFNLNLILMPGFWHFRLDYVWKQKPRYLL